MRANIRSRVVRSSYGIALMEPFDPTRYKPEDKKYVAAVGEEWAINQMEWYLQMVRETRDLTTSFHKTLTMGRMRTSGTSKQSSRTGVGNSGANSRETDLPSPCLSVTEKIRLLEGKMT